MTTFSKCLSKTDVWKRLSVPSKSLKYSPSSGEHHAVDFKVKDETGWVWTFRCYTHKKKHLKPVLTKRWRESGVCTEDEERIGARYRVKVKKLVRVFGAAFGHVSIGLPG